MDPNQATADALAPAAQEDVTPAPTAYIQDKPEEGQTARDLMDKIWDERNAPPEEVEEEAAEAAGSQEELPLEADKAEEGVEPPKEEEAAPAAPEKVEAPSYLPRDLKEGWEKVPEDMRDTIAKSHLDMTNKLTEQGRMMSGIAPIRDVLVEAAQAMPQMQDMTPQQVAREVFALAKVNNDFKANPAQAAVELIKQRGVQDQVLALLQGQEMPAQSQQVNQLMQTIGNLQNKIEQLSDPAMRQAEIEQYTTQANAVSAVDQFAQKAEHWDKVVDKMPAAVHLARELTPEASEQDILQSAYDLTVSSLGIAPETKGKAQETVEQAVPDVDPEKHKAQLRAKGVNVKSTPSGKTRQTPLKDKLGAIWDKNN